MLKSNIYLRDNWRHLVLRNLFTAHTYLELQQNEEALQLYFGLMNAGLQDSSYIMAQVAVALHNMRQVRFTLCKTLSNETKFKSVLHFVLVCTLNVTSCLSKMRVVNLRPHWMSERDCKRNFNWPSMQRVQCPIYNDSLERSLCFNINSSKTQPVHYVHCTEYLQRSWSVTYSKYRLITSKLVFKHFKVNFIFCRRALKTEPMIFLEYKTACKLSI